MSVFNIKLDTILEDNFSQYLDYNPELKELYGEINTPFKFINKISSEHQLPAARKGSTPGVLLIRSHIEYMHKNIQKINKAASYLTQRWQIKKIQNIQSKAFFGVLREDANSGLRSPYL